MLGRTLIAEQFSVAKDEQGWALYKEGEYFPVYGMTWTPTPIGENYTFDLWKQPEDYIKKTIDIDFGLMRDMGVNIIRSFATIPPQWVEYIYDNYDIYVAINYLFARYGISVNNKWYPRTDYSMQDTREKILAETIATIETYKNVRGVALFLLGNENNYGLEWKSNEIEDLPIGEQHKEKARYLYSLFGEAVADVKTRTTLPVGIVNGDIQYIDLIKEYADNIDFLATNVYRGKLVYDPSNEYSTPFYERVQEVLDKPIVYSEFGSDAYNTITKSEDQYQQADFLKSQWREIFEQSHGKGRTQSSLGGFVFSWMDEWWKKGQVSNLDTHETRGSWINGGYSFDFIPEWWDKHKNMNEEWLGIVAQSEDYYGGYYGLINKRIPRAAYYTIADIWQESMYELPTENVDIHFNAILPENGVARASELTNTETNRHGSWIKLKPLLHGAMRGHWSDADQTLAFSFEQLVHLQTELQPTEYFGARINLRFQYETLDDTFFKSYSYLGTKSDERPNDIFDIAYGSFSSQLYSSSFLLETDYFDLEGYFHDGYRLGGHEVWYLEGDFFGLLPESFYMLELDRSFSKAPFGLELTMKQYVTGLKVFIGPELFKEARPSLMAKFYREFWGGYGAVRLGALHEEELSQSLNVDTSKYQSPLARKTSLQLGYSTPADTLIRLHVDVGGLWSGMEKVDQQYATGSVVTRDPTTGFTNNQKTYETVNPLDTLATKVAVLVDFNTNPIFYLGARYTYAGAVASARSIRNYNGSELVDNGSANKHEVQGSLSLYYENLHVLAGALWRTPLIAPYYEPAVEGSRNAVSGPVIVHGNRESLQFELRATYDFTGATYFYDWNNDDREDAILATSLGLHYTVYNGETDALKYVNEEGAEVTWNTGGLERVENLYSVSMRLVSNFAPLQKVIATGRVSQTQNTGKPGIEPQLGYSATLQYFVYQVELKASLDRNVWGPEDWHTEFGFTIPWQYAFYTAYHFEKLSSLSPQHIVYAQLRGREFEGLASDAKEALNPLGSVADLRRLELTLGYRLQF